MPGRAASCRSGAGAAGRSDRREASLAVCGVRARWWELSPFADGQHRDDAGRPCSTLVGGAMRWRATRRTRKASSGVEANVSLDALRPVADGKQRVLFPHARRALLSPVSESRARVRARANRVPRQRLRVPGGGDESGRRRPRWSSRSISRRRPQSKIPMRRSTTRSRSWSTGSSRRANPALLEESGVGFFHDHGQARGREREVLEKPHATLRSTGGLSAEAALAALNGSSRRN